MAMGMAMATASIIRRPVMIWSKTVSPASITSSAAPCKPCYRPVPSSSSRPANTNTSNWSSTWWPPSCSNMRAVQDRVPIRPRFCARRLRPPPTGWTSSVRCTCRWHRRTTMSATRRSRCCITTFMPSRPQPLARWQQQQRRWHPAPAAPIPVPALVRVVPPPPPPPPHPLRCPCRWPRHHRRWRHDARRRCSCRPAEQSPPATALWPPYTLRRRKRRRPRTSNTIRRNAAPTPIWWGTIRSRRRHAECDVSRPCRWTRKRLI